MFTFCPVLSLGWCWTTGSTRSSWHCGSAGEICPHRFCWFNALRQGFSEELFDDNRLLLSFKVLSKCSNAVFQGPRGLRGLQGPMGPVGDRVSSFYLFSLSRRRFVSRCFFDLVLCLSPGLPWFQRQAWHPWHYWKDSESPYVYITKIERVY